MGLFDAIIGGGLSFLGSRETASAARDAAQANAAAITQNSNAALDAAQPWNVGSIGGTATFDPDSNTAMMGLSPELADIYSGALSRSGIWGQQAGAYGADPMEAANTFYNQQQEYWQPREDQMRTDAETRLMSQGRLGATGGARAMQGLEEAILGGQQQRQTQSLNQAQSMISTLLGRETGDIGQATGLLNIPYQLGKLGRGLGGDLGQQAAAGLASRNQAAGMIGQTNAMSPLGNTLGQLGGLFLNKGIS